MFEMNDYAKPVNIASGADLLAVCRNHEMVAQLIPRDLEMLLPRIRLEKEAVAASGKSEGKKLWFAEAWWRSAQSGKLLYFVKINLETGMLKEFRELSGDVAVSGSPSEQVRDGYLERCAEAVRRPLFEDEDADRLDEIWRKAVGETLQEAADPDAGQRSGGAYLMDPDILTAWNWEKMKNILLKRYDTSVEEIRDYQAYLDSESKERYVPLKYREEAKAQGMRFWRDGHDV